MGWKGSSVGNRELKVLSASWYSFMIASSDDKPSSCGKLILSVCADWSHCARLSVCSEFGTTRIGQEVGLLETVLVCVVSTQWCIPPDHRFDLLVLVSQSAGYLQHHCSLILFLTFTRMLSVPDLTSTFCVLSACCADQCAGEGVQLKHVWQIACFLCYPGS